MSDDGYRKLQEALNSEPEAGVVIQGTGGVRKLRWAARSRGKRGGYRIIYFVRLEIDTIWMLTLYPKNVRDTIPAHILKQIREEIENG